MPRNIVYVAPHPYEAVLRFLRATARLDDVRLLGVVEVAPTGSDAACFDDIVRVDDGHDPRCLLDAVDTLRRRHGQPWRIVGTTEKLMTPLALAREHFDVPGTRPDTAVLFRDKARMKQALRAAGLPVARHRLLHATRDAHAFAEEVGFPMVVKPPAGVGAKDTARVRSITELLSALQRTSDGEALLAEEMLTGHEFSVETLSIAGVPRAYSFSRYHPGCLEVLENPWIQWACVLPREVDAPLYHQGAALARAAITALGLEDGMSHMECFARSNGTLAIGEIAQRPPGPQLLQMTGLVHDIDPYRAWARAEIDGVFDAPWQRRYAAGTAFVRGVGRGRVAALRGVHETWEAIAPWLVEAKLPRIGAIKNDSYEGDGYVVVRAESTAKVRALIKTIVETLRVFYA
jgi:hypothetical protein